MNSQLLSLLNANNIGGFLGNPRNRNKTQFPTTRSLRHRIGQSFPNVIYEKVFHTPNSIDRHVSTIARRDACSSRFAYQERIRGLNGFTVGKKIDAKHVPASPWVCKSAERHRFWRAKLKRGTWRGNVSLIINNFLG